MSRGTTESSFSNLLTIASLPVTAFPITIACWVKAVGSANLGYGSFYYYQTQTDKWLTGGQANGTWNPTTAFQGKALQTNNANTTDGNFASLDVWYPCILVVTSADGFIRINGTVDNLQSAPGAMLTVTNGKIDIIPGFYGKIAHFSVWDKALAQAEYEAFEASDNPLTIAAANLKAYWPMTDSGLSDQSGNSFGTLSVTGTVAFDADNPTVDAPPATGIAGVSHTTRLSQGTAFSSALRLF